MMFILFSCFNYMEGILQTCSHAAISLSKKTCLLHIFLYYCRMFQSIDSQPCQGTQEALHIQAPTHLFRKTIFIQNRYSKDYILTYCRPSSTTSLKELCTAVSLKMILHSCQINAVLPYVRGLHKMMPLHGKIWFYARNVIFSKKMLHGAYIGGFEKKCQGSC